MQLRTLESAGTSSFRGSIDTPEDRNWKTLGSTHLQGIFHGAGSDIRVFCQRASTMIDIKIDPAEASHGIYQSPSRVLPLRL